MDLVIAHRRQWGWRFVDTFCWRKTDNGVPGGWGNRFKNAWEPVFHFCRQQQIKFRPQAVSHESEDCFDYSPEQSEVQVRERTPGDRARAARPRTGGRTRVRGSAAGTVCPTIRMAGTRRRAPQQRGGGEIGVLAGIALRSLPARAGGVLLAGVLRCRAMWSSIRSWGAERRWPQRHVLDRIGYGCEISPAYCDVIVRRMMNLTGETPILAATGETFAAVAESRGVPADQAMNPKQSDARAHQAPRTQSALRPEEESPGMTARSRTTNREVAGMGAASPRFRDLAVQIWPIDKLLPYARNARTHTDEQVAQVAASIMEFGWTNPILVGADGVIIAGHARLAAARSSAWTRCRSSSWIT